MMAMLLLLASAAATPPQDAAERAADDRTKMICKRFVETGSLVRGYKTCKTKWEWERERENVRQLYPNSGSGCVGSDKGIGCN